MIKLIQAMQKEFYLFPESEGELRSSEEPKCHVWFLSVLGGHQVCETTFRHYIWPSPWR